jgi:hypothetical protein
MHSHLLLCTYNTWMLWFSLFALFFQCLVATNVATNYYLSSLTAPQWKLTCTIGKLVTHVFTTIHTTNMSRYNTESAEHKIPRLRNAISASFSNWKLHVSVDITYSTHLLQPQWVSSFLHGSKSKFCLPYICREHCTKAFKLMVLV